MSQDDPNPPTEPKQQHDIGTHSDVAFTRTSTTERTKPEPEASIEQGLSQILATLDQLELQIAQYRKILADEEPTTGDASYYPQQDPSDTPVNEIDQVTLDDFAEEIAAEAAAFFYKEDQLAQPTQIDPTERKIPGTEVPDADDASVPSSENVLIVTPPTTTLPEDDLEDELETETLEEPSVDLPELFAELQSQLDMGLHSTANVSIFVDGQELLDYISSTSASGVTPEPKPLFRVFSSGKAMTAAMIWRLLDAGILDIDAPVAQYWPEFIQRGKSKVTLRHILTHTAGLPRDFGRGDVDWGDWGRMSDILASMPLEYEPGEVIHYHAITFGILVAEIASRAADSNFVELFNKEVKYPLNLRDTYFYIDDKDIDTHTRVQSLYVSEQYQDQDMPYKMDWLLDNQIISPGATCITTATDLAKLYSAVCNKGSIGDTEEWLSEDASQSVYSVHASAYDIQTMLPARIGQGVWMFDEQPNRTAAEIASRTFGHGGMGTSIAWGDPDHNVTVAIITDTMQQEDTNGRRLNRISAAIRRDLQLPIGAVAEIT